MNFKCNQKQLLDHIQIVNKSISPRTSLPILENIHVTLENNALKLRGSDLEIGIETQLPLENSTENGTFLVNSKTIHNILSKIPDTTVDVKVNESYKCMINADNVDFDLCGLSTEKYPEFPEIESGINFSLPIEVLLDCIKYTLFSVSFDSTKQFLNGILLEYKEGQLTFVSTDGYRLSIKHAAINNIDRDFSVIIPFKAMSEIQKIAAAKEKVSENIDITISEKQISSRLDSFIMVARLIQGQFPDYKQVLPKEVIHELSLSRRTFLDALDRASIIASGANDIVRITFTDNQLQIRANAPSLGDFREDIPINRVSGSEELKVAFNVKLLIDPIKTIQSDDLKLKLNGMVSPCIIEPLGDTDYTYIIMPINTSDYQQDS